MQVMWETAACMCAGIAQQVHPNGGANAGNVFSHHLVATQDCQKPNTAADAGLSGNSNAASEPDHCQTVAQYHAGKVATLKLLSMGQIPMPAHL